MLYIWGMKNYTIRQRLKMTMENIDYQGTAYWDDIDKLELVLDLLKRGRTLDDECVPVDHSTQTVNVFDYDNN